MRIFFLSLLLGLSTTFEYSASAFCYEDAGSRYGISPHLLRAIAKGESSFNPVAINHNANGSYDYGLMQINGQADSNRFIKRLEAGQRVILVVHTGAMITREASATLGKVLLSMIQSFVGRVYLSNRQKIDPPLSIFMDEAQSLLYQGVEELFAKAGAAEVMVTTFAQSVNQIYAVMGEEYGKSILDNTNTKIFMRCSDAETSDYVVKHFGVQNVLTGIFGSNQVTTREVEQDILRVQDVLSLQPREFYLLTYS